MNLALGLSFFVVAVILAACGGGKPAPGSDLQERRGRCYLRDCDDGEICNEGFYGGRCQPPRSMEIGGVCGDHDNCKSNTCHTIKGTPRCVERSPDP
ncbi:hypothetical protein [Polyangium sp. 6x1]|uniref:hypothetical protein n=1 Tax=Polyangium sp. 6x1 TaxID=3042689 RepID=UPI002482D3A5|nr:hypothetical protein [Polyangium sp. 6x1]MDI1451071.1 hypothetical protein [Polyangium sp. 6x1]